MGGREEGNEVRGEGEWRNVAWRREGEGEERGTQYLMEGRENEALREEMSQVERRGGKKEVKGGRGDTRRGYVEGNNDSKGRKNR